MLAPVRTACSVAVAVTVLLVLVSGAGGADEPFPIARGPHVSGVVRYQPGGAAAGSVGAAATCNAPGGGNYRGDCNSSGRPVNETWIAANGALFVATANDYNTYNGQPGVGFYSSTNGKDWSDSGPLDLFPHNPNNGSGDGVVAIDASGVVYVTNLFFNFHSCNVGGVYLLRRNTSGTWSSWQVAANSNALLQDKPALAIGGGKVFVSWTRFDSCSGTAVTSEIEVATFNGGGTSVAPTSTMPVPGSQYSQGSSIGYDGSGGFWIAWEEYPGNGATAEIRLAHWTGSNWQAFGSDQWQTISPGGFTDLPNPLSGFSFRTDSFPALIVDGSPKVVWTSNDTGVGRAYLWSGSAASPIFDSGDDQFFPSIASDGSGGVYVSYSQTDKGTKSFDQYLAHVTGTGTYVSRASTAPSFPNNDSFFSGQFIGDYNGLIAGHPTWTDLREANPSYPGYRMDAMVYTAPSPALTPGAPNLSGGPGDQTAHLSWRPAFDGGSPITSYELDRGSSSGGESFLASVLPTQTSYDDSGLTNGDDHYYTVKAINSAGSGASSNEVKITPATVPGPPQSPSASPVTKGKGILVSWLAPADDGGSPITSYEVWRSTNGTTFSLLKTVGGSTTSYKDPAVSKGQTYYYKARALNAIGPGAFSGAASATFT